MTNENHETVIKEEKCNCLCHSKGFRKFLTIALGSFVGVYSALCLFTALHKPPMPLPYPCPCGCGCPIMKTAMNVQPHFERGHKGEFHRKMIKEEFTNKSPVKVEIND